MSPLTERTAPSEDKTNAPGEPARRGIVLFGKTIAGRERLNIKRVWPVLFVIVALMLACRQPYAIIHPTFYAEDGAVFFKQQYEQGFGPALVTRYAGYPHLAPRTLAALCSVLPIEYIPLAYTIVCLLLAAGTLTFFFAAGFRPIVNSDSLRGCLVVIFALLPNADPLMKLADVNWAHGPVHGAADSLFTAGTQACALALVHPRGHGGMVEPDDGGVRAGDVVSRLESGR